MTSRAAGSTVAAGVAEHHMTQTLASCGVLPLLCGPKTTTRSRFSLTQCTSCLRPFRFVANTGEASGWKRGPDDASRAQDTRRSTIVRACPNYTSTSRTARRCCPTCHFAITSAFADAVPSLGLFQIWKISMPSKFQIRPKLKTICRTCGMRRPWRVLGSHLDKPDTSIVSEVSKKKT